VEYRGGGDKFRQRLAHRRRAPLILPVGRASRAICCAPVARYLPITVNGNWPSGALLAETAIE
jgi:hypothetical protein